MTLIALGSILGFEAVAREARPESEVLPRSVIYLGCGAVDGLGVVMQMEQSGQMLGVVSLAGTPYGLALYRGGLLAAIPGGTSGKGSIVKIGDEGRVETLFEEPWTVPHPISIAADSVSGDIFVADNIRGQTETW